MPFAPENISVENILAAVRKIKAENISLAPSTRYDVIIEGSAYPPKEVMRYAHERMNGERIWGLHGGQATNRFLERLGFEVREKGRDADPLFDMIARYKQRIGESHLEDEIYKWRLIERFKGRPNLEVPDIKTEALGVNYGNLAYQLARGVAKHILTERPEEYRAALRVLFDGSVDLQERITEFQKQIEAVYRQIQPNKSLGHHHDERTISILLSFKYPGQYAPYKDAFYRKFCGLIGVPVAKAGAKYVHYLQLLDGLIDDYISEDTELLALVDSFLTPDCFRDPTRRLLAQDILYQMLDKTADLNYWVMQANPNNYDLAEGLRTGEGIEDWTVTKHLKEIKAGDKVMLWSTGAEAGCYALAEVTHEPKEDRHGRTYVGIEVTDNLVEAPLLQARVRGTPGLENLKAGTQGTVFSATKAQFEKMRSLIGNDEAAVTPHSGRRYWIYAPGTGADRWDQFYNEGIAAIGWYELGDLSQYVSREEIAQRLKELHQTDSSKMNDSLAAFQFANTVAVGDVIIPKRGRREYLGYGIVESDYFYDSVADEEYPHRRKVSWKKRGVWEEPTSTVLKTLTDITKYPDYVQDLTQLIGIELEDSVPADTVAYKGPLNQILYGPPGTGKTYKSIERAVAIADPNTHGDHVILKKRFDELRAEGQIEFVTFHQSYSYEDFVVGIAPDVSAQELKFTSREGIFKRLADKARRNWAAATQSTRAVSFDELFRTFLEKLSEEEVTEIEVPMTRPGYSFRITGIDWEDGRISFTKQSGGTGHDLLTRNVKAIFEGTLDYGSQGLGIYYAALDRTLKEFAVGLASSPVEQEPLKNYVLVIDEINRANISRVFGELITLLEDDKRLGRPNELRLTLPNGERDFGVPPNLFVVGTMNTADKSIALIDIALRRRFDFVPFYPDYGTLIGEKESLLRHINERIHSVKKSADYLIGHAYFINDAPIENILQRRIIPLLMEYFSGKTELIEREIFTNSGWTVQYDTSSHSWSIEREFR